MAKRKYKPKSNSFSKFKSKQKIKTEKSNSTHELFVPIDLYI